MLDKKILLALNGADDIFLEETACKLGYNTETKERIVPMTNYRKRTFRRFVPILVAACLLLSLGSWLTQQTFLASAHFSSKMTVWRTPAVKIADICLLPSLRKCRRK